MKHFIEACFIAGGWLLLSIVAGLICGQLIRFGLGPEDKR
jgi:hypothetical protein